MTYRRAISRRRYLHSRHFYTHVELDEQSFELAERRCGHSDDAVDSILAELDLQKMFESFIRRPAEDPSAPLHRRLYAG